MTKIEIGPISEGTLKTEDLLSAFADVVEEHHPRSETVVAARMYAELLEAGHLNEEGEQAAAELVGDLTGILDELAPDYVHFGASEGDGACFGFWPSIESLEEDARNGDVLKVSDLGEVPAGHIGHVMQVSDHGNVTLYSFHELQGNRIHTYIWSCV